jgi:hypothetical protein
LSLFVRGYLSVSLPPLSFPPLSYTPSPLPHSPLFICTLPHSLYHHQVPNSKSRQLPDLKDIDS